MGILSITHVSGGHFIVSGTLFTVADTIFSVFLIIPIILFPGSMQYCAPLLSSRHFRNFPARAIP